MDNEACVVMMKDKNRDPTRITKGNEKYTQKNELRYKDGQHQGQPAKKEAESIFNHERPVTPRGIFRECANPRKLGAGSVEDIEPL
jgi:hypothetical protein